MKTASTRLLTSINILLALLLIALGLGIPAPAPATGAYAYTEWSAMTSGTTETLYSVWGTSSSNVYTAGERGTILHYNGATWSRMNSGIEEDLFCIWGTSNNDIFAVGGSGTILHFNGTAWSVVTTETTVDPYLSVWGTSPSNVYVSGGGGIILHYDGSSWSSPMSSSTTAGLRCLWGSSNNDIYAVGDSGTVVHFNGTNWSGVTTGAFNQLQGVYGTSASDVYAVGANTYVYHYNGTNWSSTEPGSLGLAGIWGTSASNYFAVGWPNKAIWHYNGATWTYMRSAADSANNLFSVWGPCSSEAFAVGMNGMILHYGVCNTNVTSASVNTNLGAVLFNINAGSISGLRVAAPACGAANYSFPYGMFSFNITNLNPGQQVAVLIRFPNPLPLNARYYKCVNGTTIDCTSLITRIDQYTLQLNLTDGGRGDTDGAANGAIADPGGPALPLNNTPQSSSASMPATPQAPVNLSNVAVKSASLSATKVTPGTPVTVTADVTNTGTGNGTANIKVYVNGQEETSQGVTVNSGGRTQISFNVTRNEPGTYTVYVGGAQAGNFTVDQFTPDTILIISGALVFFALVTGIIYMARKRA